MPMPLPHPLPEPLVELIAQRFRALAEPMRIRVLDQLREGDASVQELTEALGSSQQNVSKHLATLLQHGIVARERHGNRVRYRIADDGVLGLCEEVCGGLRQQLSELDALLGQAGR
jgi:DNA-binding transcriptional ArsR family regulator